ncbi:hypothetical protein [Burkholderia multivorans]|uniref:hypothetical protein n=1 Tax=Burkholderia multivorans TaxID=87883 RepID=UPI002019D3B0|nr:hypothetical protein [Burkholderia multivorans]MCL4649965.1 hypothetical protein [Burkholderia multivorans]MCL4658827.1 hypothetical protein [Burkholderia multivorans]MCO1424753.1 hypothetical protein [Burkholderia multivorans]UQN54693.1 hypothetical protein L0Y88_24455 [Burkholderia multivorans]UQN80380.1 hypothetical protein L0Z18_12305 [Burkholderia multivorans]
MANRSLHRRKAGLRELADTVVAPDVVGRAVGHELHDVGRIKPGKRRIGAESSEQTMQERADRRPDLLEQTYLHEPAVPEVAITSGRIGHAGLGFVRRFSVDSRELGTTPAGRLCVPGAARHRLIRIPFAARRKAGWVARRRRGGIGTVVLRRPAGCRTTHSTTTLSKGAVRIADVETAAPGRTRRAPVVGGAGCRPADAAGDARRRVLSPIRAIACRVHAAQTALASSICRTSS